MIELTLPTHDDSYYQSSSDAAGRDSDVVNSSASDASSVYHGDIEQEFDEIEGENQFEEADFSSLYEGAAISLIEAMLAILQFSLRYVQC